MHMDSGASHTTLPGNLRKTTRNICPDVELTASEAVRVRRIPMFLPHSDPLSLTPAVFKTCQKKKKEKPGGHEWPRMYPTCGPGTVHLY